MIDLFNVNMSITKGYICVLHHGSVELNPTASVKKQVELWGKLTGQVALNTKLPQLLIGNPSFFMFSVTISVALSEQG